MVTPVETRWNSSLMMMKSVIQLRPALEAVKECTHKSTDSRLQEIIPEQEDFDLIDSIIPILSKFESVSEFMSGETYPTICHVMVKICFLQMSLKKIIDTPQPLDDASPAELCANMAKDLEKRFPKYGANEKTMPTLIYFIQAKRVQFCINFLSTNQLLMHCWLMKKMLLLKLLWMWQ